MSEVSRYVSRMPWIDWRTPITITIEGESYKLCRICVAKLGVRAVDVPGRAFESFAGFLQHLADEHGS